MEAKRRPRRAFTDEFKASAVALVVDEGRSVSAVARDLDLPSIRCGRGSSVSAPRRRMHFLRTSTLRMLLSAAAVVGMAGCRHDPPAQPQPPGPTLSIEDGVFVLRLVASLEFEHAGAHQPAQYLPLSGITAMSDPWLKKNITMVDSEDGAYKGYALRVTADGPRFDASLVPDKRGCGLAFFVDERMLIYSGYGLGCRGKH